MGTLLVLLTIAVYPKDVHVHFSVVNDISHFILLDMAQMTGNEKEFGEGWTYARL